MNCVCFLGAGGDFKKRGYNIICMGDKLNHA